MVQVLAINSSPLMDKGNTALILAPFLEGMKEAGAEAELVYTKTLKINPCQGEFNCWFKTPGKCFQDDDMQTLYPKLRAADIWVIATPLYVDGASGPMKNLLDRIIPLVQPTFELREGHCRHPLREGSRRGLVALVSNCGLWELDNFDPLIIHVKAICKNANREFAGALLRPHGPALRPMRDMGFALDDVFQAAREAGRQLIHDRKMSPESLGIVSRELLPLETYMQVVNEEFQRTGAGNLGED